MICLLRFLQQASLWPDTVGTSVSVESSLNLLLDVYDAKGPASYWLVDYDNQLESLGRAVAAYISAQSAINGLNVGLLPMTEITRLGISVAQVAASNADEEFGNCPITTSK